MTEQNFRKLVPEALTDNVFKLIGKDWMLVTAGDPDDFNTMTASWGGMGILWGKPVAFVFVRPQRHTYGYMEAASHFTLSFFDEAYRDALNYCGTHSGRDVDKMAATGLTPVTSGDLGVVFAEARLAMICRKLYAQDLTATSFVATEIIDQAYATRDFHRLYVGEIVGVLAK